MKDQKSTIKNKTMTIKLELPCVDLKVELPKELLDFNEDQLKFIKDFEIQAESAGVKLYGEIGLPKPR